MRTVTRVILFVLALVGLVKIAQGIAFAIALKQLNTDLSESQHQKIQEFFATRGEAG
jgi:hypothetical protein